MKLLWVCQGVPKVSDGSLLIAYHLALFLSKRHEQDLIFLKAPDDASPAPAFFKDAIGVPFTPKKALSNRFKNALSLKPNLVNYYFSKAMGKEIYRLTQVKKYDIIIVTTMNMSQFVYKLKAVKKVAMPHDAEHLIYRQILKDAKGPAERVRPWLWWKKACMYQKHVYPFFDLCLFVSQRDKTAIESLSDHIKAEVLPNGVDTDFFKPNARTKKDILIFTGVMNTWSNMDAVTYLVREILPVVERSIPSIKFYIVGKRPAASVMRLAGKNVVVTGEVPDIRPYLEEASIFVAPFRIGTGVKHKILEAMAMEVPVVSTPLGANGIEVKSGENIMLADSPQDFAASIVELFRNKDLKETIVRNARMLASKKYTWENIGQSMEDLLKGVLIN